MMTDRRMRFAVGAVLCTLGGAGLWAVVSDLTGAAWVGATVAPDKAAVLAAVAVVAVSAAVLVRLSRDPAAAARRTVGAGVAPEDRVRLVDAPGHVMLLIDPGDGRIVDANAAAVAFYGHPRDRLLRLTLDALTEPPGRDTPTPVAATWRQALAGARVRHRLASGEVRAVEIYSHPVRTGAETHLHAIVHDVTDRDRLAETLARAVDVHRAFAALAETLLAGVRVSIDEIAAHVLTHGKALTDSPIGFVGYIDEATGHLVCPTFSGETWAACAVAGKSAVFERFTGLWGWVLRERDALMTNSPADDPRSVGTPAGHLPISRFLGAPALIDGRLVGVVALANAGRPYDVRDLDVARRLATMFAIAIRRWCTEAALRDSEERARLLVEALPDAVVVHRRGRIAYVNPAGLRLLDAPDAAALLGRDSDCLFADGRGGCAGGGAGETPAQPVELSLRRLDGTVVPVESRTAAIRFDGESAILAIARDISDRKRAERALRLATERAEEASRAKTRFLAAMSHELRTPLNAIIGFSEIIQSLMLGRDALDKYVEYARDINVSGRSLLAIVNDILTLSRIEAGRLTVTPTPVDLSDLIADAVAVFRDAIYAKGLGLTVAVERDTLRQATVDRRAVKQILLNLISNAVKFTPLGGAVHVSARRHPAPNQAIELAVADSGVGIPDDEIKRVLTPFGHLELRDETVPGSTGLGLAMVDQLARLHGGHIAIASTVGIGTTVTVTLPQPTADHPAAGLPPPERRAAE